MPFALLCAPSALAQPAAARSIHEAELQQHRLEPLRPRIVPPAQRLLNGRTKSVNRIVYGYYPYWMHDLTTIRWEALTHMAWFAVEMNSSGQATSKHGWPDSATVTAAHNAGVRVDLAFTLFDSNGIATLCNSATNRARAVDTMVDLMQEGGADGVSVDFEGVPASARDNFTALIAELRDELDGRGLTDAQISIAGPAVDWSKAFDLAALLDHADYYFIMGYDFFWSGSGRAGPSGIMRITEDWSGIASYCGLRSIAYYTSLIPDAKRSQIIYGVPYYGREWTTTTNQMGAPTIANVAAVSYAAAMEDLAAGRQRQWHDGIKNPWYVWQEGGQWHQVYYDDAESLAAKYDMALAQNLGGVGMWALNHDSGHTELWDLLEQKFGAEPAQPPGHRFDPIPIKAFPFHDERDTSEGPSGYFNYYSCRSDLPEYGREWVYRLDVCQPGTLTARVPEYDWADPDVHLLSDLDSSACLQRSHTEISTAIQPGTYYVTVDTFVDQPVELEGPYTLDVDFVPEAGSVGCASHLACSAGQCVCPDAATTDCQTGCFDLQTTTEHCGACNRACEPGQQCVAGSCVGGQPPVDGGTSDGAAGSAGQGGQAGSGQAGSGQAGSGHAGSGQAGSSPADGGEAGSGQEGPETQSPGLAPATEEEGCGCRTAGSSSTAPWWAAMIGLFAAHLLRRKR